MTGFRLSDYLPDMGRKGKKRYDNALLDVEQRLEMIHLLRSIKKAVQFTGMGLAAIAVQFDENSWVCRSALFNTVGAMTTFALLSYFVLLAICVNFVYDNRVFIMIAKDLWPVGVQPWRSAVGIIAVFIALSYITRIQKLTADINQDRFRKLRIIAWTTAAVVWCVLAGFLATKPIILM